LRQHSTKTCHITPATDTAPYRAVIHDGNDAIADRMFETHDEAIGFAVEELRRSSLPSSEPRR